MSSGITVLAGTTKGLFLITGTDGAWSISGPHCGGWAINHAIGKGAVLHSAGGGDFFGAGVWRSGDGGETWELTKLADGQMDEWVRSDPETAKLLGVEATDPAPYSGQVDAMWSLARIGNRLYAGGKPGMLFSSTDEGLSWHPVTGITEHPTRDAWAPGAVGMTLHTIFGSPDDQSKIWIAISAAGVFASEDGGETFDRRNRLANGELCGHVHHPAGPRDGETGHCVHNMVRAPGQTDLLYQQNHHGVWRSRDGGRSWEDAGQGLPSTFGFPIAVHPTKPDTIWSFPLNGDMAGRFPPDACAAVWRSRDGGDTWEACREGLPQGACYFTVLRQAMAVDDHEAPGVYFGTNSGSIFASFDEGDSWSEIARHLPTVLSIETVARA